MSPGQNTGWSHNIKIDNSSFERVVEFKYLRTTLLHQNSIQEENKSRLKSGDACYHVVQNRLSSILLSKNIKIKIYWSLISPVALYGCETWLLILREERRLRVFENRVLRRIFGPKMDKVTGEWRKLVTYDNYYCTDLVLPLQKESDYLSWQPPWSTRRLVPYAGCAAVAI